MDSTRQQTELDDYTRSGMIELIEYMYDNLEEFKLLVNSSYGTKYQNFVENLVNIETDYTYKYMKTIGVQIKKGSPLTKDFMHIMNKALFESFFEVVRHNMSKEEARRYICMLEKYHSAGWEHIYSECSYTGC